MRGTSCLALSAALLMSGLMSVQAGDPVTADDHQPVIVLNAADPVFVDILAALQPSVESLVGQDLLLVVNEMKIQGDFAFVAAETQNPDGSAIDFSTTAIADWADELFDGPHLWAYLKQVDGQWTVLEQDIGPTDAWFVYWPQAHGGSCVLTGLADGC